MRSICEIKTPVIETPVARSFDEDGQVAPAVNRAVVQLFFRFMMCVSEAPVTQLIASLPRHASLAAITASRLRREESAKEATTAEASPMAEEKQERGNRFPLSSKREWPRNRVLERTAVAAVGVESP